MKKGKFWGEKLFKCEKARTLYIGVRGFGPKKTGGEGEESAAHASDMRSEHGARLRTWRLLSGPNFGPIGEGHEGPRCVSCDGVSFLLDRSCGAI